ncbi:MAG: tetratricopeptide repeat protein, partial [Alkalispirochaetaceae bacterium]
MNEAIRLYRQGKYEQALHRLLELHVEDAQEGELSYYLGLCYASLKQHDEAILYLEQVVSSNLGFLYVYQSRMLLGYIYSVTERFRLAEFEFQRLLEDGYESAKVYAALAYVLYQQRQAAPAIAHLEKALRIDPENANAMNSLGYILAESSENLELAFSYCQKAARKKPNNPAYLDSLALAYERRGQLQHAIKLYRHAYRLSGGHQLIGEHLKSLEERTV